MDFGVKFLLLLFFYALFMFFFMIGGMSYRCTEKKEEFIEFLTQHNLTSQLCGVYSPEVTRRISDNPIFKAAVCLHGICFNYVDITKGKEECITNSCPSCVAYCIFFTISEMNIVALFYGWLDSNIIIKNTIVDMMKPMYKNV